MSVALLAYGIADLRRQSDDLPGILEAGTGLLVALYLFVYQLEGVTDSSSAG